MDLIDKIKHKGITVAELSMATSIPTARIYKWFDGTSTPKYNDVKKLELFLNIPINEAKKELVQEIGHMDILRDLARSNIILADANKSLAESNRVLAENNKEIIKKYDSPNLNSDQHISATLIPYLERIALGGVGKFWKDENVGIVELNKMLLGLVKTEIKLDK